MVEGGKLEVENPAEALRDQDGTFRVVSPSGLAFQFTCRRGSNMRIHQIGESETQLLLESQRWRIEKLA
jgi:hypothetical protein